MNSKASLLIAIAVFFGSSLAGRSERTNSFYEFVVEQSARRYSKVPHEVLAFYYGWYGQAWERSAWGKVEADKHQTGRTARYPVKGAYSSHDPEVIDWQIDQAQTHGITGFIVSWWGTDKFEDWHSQSLDLLIARAEKKNFKISIYWEQAPGAGQQQIGRAIDELSRVLKQHGRSKAFLKLDGKPVVFSYSRVFSFQMPVASWPEVIRGVRERVGDFVLIADGQQDSWSYLFDGIHSYDLNGCPMNFQNHLQPSNLEAFRQWIAAYYAKGVKVARQRGRISCLMVVPGGDARKAYKVDTQTERLDGQMYRTLWEEAVKANPDWIVITSWNEWPEGTEIEPSLELGDKYLQITAEYAGPFLKSAPVDVPAPGPLPKFAPGTTLEASKLLLGRKIAVLAQPQVYDREFWAAYCGGALERVDWKDLIDPKFFNASHFPVFIHIAAEHYTSSIKVTDDVTRSLTRYHREGGFLVSLPSLSPWPMHYDDSRKGTPRAITDALGMGVDNGFDAPPANTLLTLHVKTNILLGLAPAAPFPRWGDLRFRPANRARVPAADAYVPLIQLQDQAGHLQGDAAAYIEHRTQALSPGKTLYVWTRTDEAFDSESFYLSLYRFIASRLKPLPAEK